MFTTCEKHKHDLKLVLSLCLLCVIVLAAFIPCLKNGFLNWDDDMYVTANPAVQSLSPANFKNIFTSFFIGHYQPVTILSYLFEFHFFGLNPSGYHLTNLILHLFNCLLVFWLVFVLTQKSSISWITAILFGIHPLQVESVAWISERKNMLYALFFLASMISYLYYLKKGRALKYYYFSLLLFILSLLSKAMAVTLPLALLILDYSRYRKTYKIILIEKIPYFILSFMFGVIAIFGVYISGSVRQGEAYGVLSRLMTASYGIVFYLNKLLLPIGLSPLYPYHGTKNLFLYIYSFVALVILLIGIIISSRYTKKILLGSSLFLVIILPALQFIPNGEIIVADRYLYIASIGIFYILAEGFIWLYTKRTQYFRIIRTILLITLVVVTTNLISITRNRCRAWKDNISLWSDVLSKYPRIATAYNNRGAAFLAEKQYDKAYSDFMNALRIDPSYYEAYFNLGSLLYSAKGNYSEAIRLFNKTLLINPDFLKAYDALAMVYGVTGGYYESIKICEKIIQKEHNHVQAYINLCIAYGNLGNLQEAIANGDKAVTINPISACAHWNLSIAYFYAKKYDLAIDHCDRAIALGYGPVPEFLEELKPHRK
jgi:tetratricopeptide (TPR) repeat protein